MVQTRGRRRRHRRSVKRHKLGVVEQDAMPLQPHRSRCRLSCRLSRRCCVVVAVAVVLHNRRVLSLEPLLVLLDCAAPRLRLRLLLEPRGHGRRVLDGHLALAAERLSHPAKQGLERVLAQLACDEQAALARLGVSCAVPRLEVGDDSEEAGDAAVRVEERLVGEAHGLLRGRTLCRVARRARVELVPQPDPLLDVVELLDANVLLGVGRPVRQRLSGTQQLPQPPGHSHVALEALALPADRRTKAWGREALEDRNEEVLGDGHVSSRRL